MSITTLAEEAMEGGFYPITFTFKDESSAVVTPDASSISWTLTDKDGSIINGRLNATEASATAVTIELEGDDLAIQTGETAPVVRRHVCMKWTYASTYGTGKMGRAECVFPLRNLTRIPSTSTSV